MDPDQISSLAKLLRDSGDKVLNANFKLTLSGSLLKSLNDSFTLIADQNEICPPLTFQVVKPNNSISNVFRDLQFIHDFVQKTQILLITQLANDDQFKDIIDISKFRNLRRLEIQRVYINQVMGIQQMRAHLQEIVCQRCVDSVKDIISHCGGDRSNGFIWNELKFADFSYNTLMSIDCSLEFAPWLQHLDLSHNHIVSADAIKWLPNLKYLNLSFNRLTHIPMFNADASKKLKTLVLSSNYIEDIGEISRLDSLTDLDLSGNCLLDHSYLLPLSTLISLTYLNLEGNPLSCHPKHRQATARYLHKNTSNVKFILDTQQLNKIEKGLTGTYQSYHLILTSRVSMNAFDKRSSSGQSTPTKWTRENTAASSSSSLSSITHSSYQKGANSSIDEMMYTSMTSPTTTQKRIKARNVIIADNDEMVQPQIEPGTSLKLEGNQEYLETKKQVEELRNRFGDSWLLNHGESIDMNRDSINERFENETESIGVETITTTTTTDVTSSVTIEPKATLTPLEIGAATMQQPTTNDNTTLSPNVAVFQGPLTPATLTQVELNEIYTQDAATADAISDSEDNETTYIASIEPSGIEVFLIVSDFSIKEKDSLSGRTKNKWSLKSLESCDQIRTDVLRLNFDTIKKDKKERIYVVEDGVGTQLEQFLRAILSKRPLSEMNLTLYRCANCITQFSRDNIYKKQNMDLCCPECKSLYIIEIKDTHRAQSVEKHLHQQQHQQQQQHQHQQQQQPTVSAIQSFQFDKKKNIEHCESFSSAGSVASLNESSSCSKLSKSDGGSFDSNQSVVGSSNSDRDADFNSGVHGESDIEILSNPSQSSIEVLDSFYISASRKHSDDGQLTFQTSALDPIEDTGSGSYKSPTSIDASSLSSSVIVNQQTSTGDLDGLIMMTAAAAPSTSLLSPSQSAIVAPPAATTKSNDLGESFKLGPQQLTESSSSGSVTDSICTTYEQQQKQQHQQQPQSSPMKYNKSPEKTPKAESVISTMFGGLFQSTNSLMSRSQKSDQSSSKIQCEPFKFSYTEFDNVDHRLKLYFYQNLFDDDNEHFKWMVKGRIIVDQHTMAGGSGSGGGGNGSIEKCSIIDGIFLMSTTKFYILHIIDKERDEIDKWIKRYLSGTVDRVTMIQILPWKIGVTLSIKSCGTIYILLQDILRTDSLLLYFANNPLPDYCTLEYTMCEILSQKLLQTTEHEQLKMLAILNHSDMTSDDPTSVAINEEYPALIVTDGNLYLSASTNRWIWNREPSVNIPIRTCQLMINLIDVSRVIDERSIKLNFLDETQDRNDMWICSFETDSNMESTLNAIGQSWEKLFGVPLGVTYL